MAAYVDGYCRSSAVSSGKILYESSVFGPTGMFTSYSLSVAYERPSVWAPPAYRSDFTPLNPALVLLLLPRTDPAPTTLTIGVAGGRTLEPSLMSQSASWTIESPEFAVM